MAYTYKAFISYRHKALDSNVAVKVQRTIEHYKVPKELRDLAGGKKIGKVFRDEDELPLSSSLSDSIVYALDNSEFLIVICTPDLPLSKWCEQEIRYFLSTHDRDHIITVLAQGSPEESFSPLLLHTYDEEGNITGDTEPLAANIVADTDIRRWKLFAKEKIRILASLIGCSFDELYQREQRYKRRRALAFGSVTAAVALSFIGLLINRNAAIRKNYEQALRNQSVYLASESQRLLGEGDRFSSIALAIEALPSEEKDRPLVSKAEYALARSTNAYETDWYRNRRSNYAINSALKHSDDVSSFMLNEKGDMIVSLTTDNTVTAWDSEKNIRKWTYQVDIYSNAGIVDILSDNTVIIQDGGSVVFIDGQNGIVKYELDGVQERNFVYINGAITSDDHRLIAVSSSLGINVFNTESKEEICGIEYTDYTELEALSFSEDGNMIAVGYYQKLVSYHGYEGIRVYDTGSGDLIADLDSFSADGLYWLDVLFVEDNKLCVSYGPYYFDISGTTFMFFAEKDHYLSLYDVENGKRIWEVASKYSSTNFNHMTLATDSLGDDTAFVNIYSNYVDIVDAETGNVLAHAEYPSVVVHAEVYDNAVQCITSTGGFGGLKAGAGEWSLVQTFVSDLESVIYDESDYWMVQNGSDSILHYGYVDRDTSWIGIRDNIPSDTERSNFNNSWTVSDKDSFVIGSYNWREFLYFKPGENELAYKAFSDGSAEAVSTYKYKVIRYKDGVLSLLKYPSAGPSEMCNINMATDDVDIYLQSDDGMEFCDVIGDSAAEEWYGIAFSHNENWESGYYLVSFDYEFNLKSKVLIKADTYSSEIPHVVANVGKFFDKDGSVYVKLAGDDETYVIDLRNHTVQECSGDMGEILTSVRYSEMEARMSYDANAHITAINTGDRTVLFDKNRTVIGEIEDGSSDIISVSFAENSKCILTLCKDNQIRRFDSKTGEMLSRCDIDYNCSSINPHDVNWIETDKGFMILMLSDRCSFLIRENDWDIFTAVPDCTAYLPSEDFFVLIPSDFANCECGGFKRHTVESLTEYGREILGDWELSETQRMQYGIE